MTRGDDPDIRGGDSGGADSDRLQSLLAISDTRLNRVGASDLVNELLERIRDILDADSAVMLLVDEGGEHLIAEATLGLAEDLRQRARVPIGAGFAGTIAAQRRPQTTVRTGPDFVADPMPWEEDLRTMAGAPMLSDEQLVGVLTVGRLTDRAFSEEDMQLVLVAAERLAGAATARQLEFEMAAAQHLERSLLPSRFPTVTGAEFAGRYASADRLIGGDWYDVFTVPGDALWLVVGDVSGHGLGSAVVMGRIRSTLRAYALLAGDPAEVLEMTDRKVHHFGMGRMTTVLCAVAEPPYERFVLSSAGHPSPVLAPPDTDARLVEVHADLPLGSVPDSTRTTTVVDVPLGGVLVLYTDGLVERIGEPIDEGMERLQGCMAADHPEIVCRSVMRQMIGSASPRDDVALLTMRHTAH